MGGKKIALLFKVKRSVMAVGGELKNTLCFIRGKNAHISPVHQDLLSAQGHAAFKRDAAVFLRRRPQVIACDLHPGYQSSAFALSLAGRYRCVGVQHHHAHIASCMAENLLGSVKVIGVAFDGTGLGIDSRIWGAEFMVCDYARFTRKGHLREVPLLGAEAAIREPWRVAAAWLCLAYDGKLPQRAAALQRIINKDAWQVLERMQERGFNCPMASSMGRLFDATASLLLARPTASFEADLAVSLERLALACAGARAYDFSVRAQDGIYIIDPAPIMRSVLRDLGRRRPLPEIAYAFHASVAEMVRRVCCLIRKETGVRRVVLSGGVFQNSLLLRLTLGLLYREKFVVFKHERLSCNDSGISLGQAVVAGWRG